MSYNTFLISLISQLLAQETPKWFALSAAKQNHNSKTCHQQFAAREEQDGQTKCSENFYRNQPVRKKAARTSRPKLLISRHPLKRNMRPFFARRRKISQDALPEICFMALEGLFSGNFQLSVILINHTHVECSSLFHIAAASMWSLVPL